jgi:nucleotide-binding universal stress UspA family protein
MYQRILVPLDGSKSAECVLSHVESIAEVPGVENVVFLRVVEPFHTPGGCYDSSLSIENIKRMDSEQRVDAENYLKKLGKQIRYEGVNVQPEVITGRAADCIAEYATKNAVSLIIMATHGRSGVSRWVWGSVADRILRSACVPILMVRAPGCIPELWAIPQGNRGKTESCFPAD